MNPDNPIGVVVKQTPAHPEPTSCTCHRFDPGYDPSCPYHGQHGTMVVDARCLLNPTDEQLLAAQGIEEVLTGTVMPPPRPGVLGRQWEEWDDSGNKVFHFEFHLRLTERDFREMDAAELHDLRVSLNSITQRLDELGERGE